MNKTISILIVCTLAVGLIGNVYAHKGEVVGDYKIEVGWKSEPPVVGITNAIEIIITIAAEFDKGSLDHDDSIKHEEMTHEEHEEEMEQEVHEEEMEKNSLDHDDSIKHEGMTHEEHEEEMEQEVHEVEMEHLEPGAGVTDLVDKLEAIISLDGEKTELILVEQSKAGIYHAVYTPAKVGFSSVNLVGEIGHSEFEITFHPEKVEDLNALRPLQQIKANIVPSDVQCREGLQLVQSPTGRPACVFESSALKLMSRGWIQ